MQKTILLFVTVSGLLLASANAFADDLDVFVDTQQDASVTDTSDTASSSWLEKGSNLVVSAMAFLGVPYHLGGKSAETGFDCSGFVRAIYSQAVGLLLPRTAREQADATAVISKDDLKPGDLVFFNTLRHAFSHVGIYIGNGKFIHSPRSGSSVRIESLNTPYWNHRFNGARRVLIRDNSTNLSIH